MLQRVGSYRGLGLRRQEAGTVGRGAPPSRSEEMRLASGLLQDAAKWSFFSTGGVGTYCRFRTDTRRMPWGSFRRSQKGNQTRDVLQR